VPPRFSLPAAGNPPGCSVALALRSVVVRRDRQARRLRTIRA
jgi:hypothetical protein